MREREGRSRPRKQPEEVRVSPDVDLALSRPERLGTHLVPGAPPRARPSSVAIVAEAYAAHQRELFSFALATTRSREEAEDLVQESFLRLVAVLRDGTPPSNTRAWLYRVCANLAISRGRRHAVADRWRHLLGAETATEESPEHAATRREDEGRLAVALTGLGTLERVALVLASRGLSGREVAAVIGKSEGASRTILFRARSRLRARLSEGDAT